MTMPDMDEMIRQVSFRTEYDAEFAARVKPQMAFFKAHFHDNEDLLWTALGIAGLVLHLDDMVAGKVPSL